MSGDAKVLLTRIGGYEIESRGEVIIKVGHSEHLMLRCSIER